MSSSHACRDVGRANARLEKEKSLRFSTEFTIIEELHICKPVTCLKAMCGQDA
jgi:hypothetical protein